jgi:peptidoglycan/LPS O-acetylase OafA/YrhL
MKYNPALDGVRAISILTVLFFHCRTPGVNGGFVGLDVFFVLSGYLITSLLAVEYQNGGIDIGRFYGRRALRLYPTLLLMLAAYVVLAPVLWPTDNQWLMAALSGFYVLDYGLAFWDLPVTIGHTWSLGVEEKFYLLWPLLLPLFLKARRPIVWLLVAFLAVTTWRYFVVVTWGWKQAYFCFDTRMSGILLGAIAALVRPRVPRHVAIVACVALAVVIALPTARAGSVNEGDMWRNTVAELSSFALIGYLAEHAKSRFFTWGPLVYTGKLSYGIYIWHFPVLYLLSRSDPLWFRLGVTLLFSFTMAAICLHLVDMPIKRWRGRWKLPSMAGSLPQDS